MYWEIDLLLTALQARSWSSAGTAMAAAKAGKAARAAIERNFMMKRDGKVWYDW